MTPMNFRNMPTRNTARCYIALASLLAIPFGLQPTAILFAMLSICCLSVGTLSIPRASYTRVILYSALAGIVPAAIVWLISHSPAYAVVAFSVAPASAWLVWTVRRRYSRSAGILGVAALLTLTLAGAALLWLWLRAGSLSASVFKQLYVEVKSGFVSYVVKLLEETPDLFFMSGMDPQTAPKMLFDLLLTVLPGAFLTIMWVIAWFATACLRRVFMGYLYGIERFKDWKVTVWKPLSYVFLGSFTLALLPIPGDVYTVIGIVCYNIFPPLFPIFTIVGCRMLKERLKRQPGFGCITVIALFVFFIVTPVVPLLVMAVTGAIQTIFPPKFPPVPPSPFAPPPGQGNPYTPPTSRGYGEEDDDTDDSDDSDTDDTDGTDSDSADDTDDTDDQGGASE